jgi:Putative collagen-binding domain of a collagenase
MIDDRSLAIVYLPSTQKVRVNLLRLQGRSAAARWFAPAEGRYITAEAKSSASYLRLATADSKGIASWSWK